MVKTTVYLPAELKARLERAARLQRRSEAEVIRAAIDQYTLEHHARPTFPLFNSGRVSPIVDWDEAMHGFGRD